jgi:L-asparaginase II
MTSPLVVRGLRGGYLETEHLVDAAVTDASGALVAAAGEPARATWWRSAAKPFQAAACVRAGAADRFGFGEDALALACASHSSEAAHLALAARMLEAAGCGERDLACGGHAPLAAEAHARLLAAGVAPGPLHSNCSGKHAAMLALARHVGAAVRGYERPDHAVQRLALAEVAAAADLPDAGIPRAGDGCRAPTFLLPLTGMARAWARLGAGPDPVLARLRDAMVRHPRLVAGEGRSCTRLLAAGAGRLVVKVGAEGVYSAALPEAGLGLAVTSRSGDGRAATVALCAVLAALDERLGLGLPHASWADLARPEILDTRGEVAGTVEPGGALRWA